MKKILMSILLILFIFLSYYVIANGVHIGNFEAYGYQKIAEENTNIDNKITNATKLTSADFPQKMSELTKNTKTLLNKKEEYLTKTTYSTEGQIAQANERESYAIEFLHERVGTYVKREGLTGVNMNITTATDSATSIDGRKMYDLNFNIQGSYAASFFFISSLENDEKLQFKIENFKMVPGSEGSLATTFVVKNIPIEGISNLSTQSSSNTTSTNTTNTTNNTNTTNTTNTTNSAS